MLSNLQYPEIDSLPPCNMDSSVKHVTKLLELRGQEVSFPENIPLFSNIQQLVVSQVLSRSHIMVCLGSYS